MDPHVGWLIFGTIAVFAGGTLFGLLLGGILNEAKRKDNNA